MLVLHLFQECISVCTLSKSFTCVCSVYFHFYTVIDVLPVIYVYKVHLQIFTGNARATCKRTLQQAIKRFHPHYVTCCNNTFAHDNFLCLQVGGSHLAFRKKRGKIFFSNILQLSCALSMLSKFFCLLFLISTCLHMTYRRVHSIVVSL